MANGVPSTAKGDSDQVDTQEFRLRLILREKSAWIRLVRHRHKWLMRIAFRLGAAPEELEEIAQDTWLKFLSITLNPERPITPLLMVICRNTTIDRVRRHHPTAATDLGLALDLLSVTGQSSRADGQQLERAIDMLPGPEREVIDLHFFMHKSAADISELLEASKAAVYKRLSRAIQRLRDLLQGWSHGA